MDINIILREEDGAIDILFNGYNIIATTIYNEELTKQIIKLIENELKNTNCNFENFKQFLTIK